MARRVRENLTMRFWGRLTGRLDLLLIEVDKPRAEKV